MTYYRSNRYVPLLETNEETEKEQHGSSNFINITIAGFNLFYTRSIRDGSIPDLIFLDLIGPLESIRGAWASLRNRKQSIWALGGPIKMQRDPGHTIIKSVLPYGDQNWTIIQNQALPSKMRWDLPVYFWAEIGEFISESSAPEKFLPAFKKSAPFPIKDEWSDYLWQKGVDKRLITNIPDYTRIRGFKLNMQRERWEEVIQDGIGGQWIV